MIQRFPADGTHKTFGIGVHIGCFNGSGNTGDVVGRVVLEELGRSVMDQESLFVQGIREGNNALPDKLTVWELGP